MVRELGFEMKAQPSNRMKTEEELAKEEQERLEKLEVGLWPGRVGRVGGLSSAFCEGAADALLYQQSPLRFFEVYVYFTINIPLYYKSKKMQITFKYTK